MTLPDSVGCLLFNAVCAIGTQMLLSPTSPVRHLSVHYLMARLTPIESEFATSEEASAYDAWFRAKVERAMTSDTPSIPHAEVMAMAQAILDKHKPR